MLIGLTGYAGSGKDTAADHLVKVHGFERRAFADKLRELAYAQDRPTGVGWGLQRIVDAYGWDKAKRLIPGVREILQQAGQAHREVFGEDFWVDQVLPLPEDGWLPYRYPGGSRLPRVPNNVVVTDVRYQNEADRIRALGGVIVAIDREGVGPVNDHPSEKPIESDRHVRNENNNPAALFFKLDRLIIRLTEENS